MAPLMSLALALSLLPAQDQELKKGQMVSVLLKNGQVLEGQIVNVTPAVLVLYIADLGGNMSQSRENVEHISDAKTGTPLGWREVDAREKPKPVEPDVVKPVEPVKPTDTTPTDTTEDAVKDKSPAARALEARLIAYQEGAFSDTDALQKELAEKSTSATAYIVPLIKELDAATIPAAGIAIIRFKESDAVKLVQPLLTEKRKSVRKMATEALVTLAPQPDAYLPALQDVDAEIRAIAMRGLSNAVDPAFVKYSAPLVADDDSIVRGLAVKFLAEWGKRNDGQDRWQAAGWVADHINSTKSYERRARALEFLGEVPCPDVVSTLRESWDRVDKENGRWEQIAIAKSLGRTKLEESAVFLRDLLRQTRPDGDIGVAQQLAIAAMDLGDRLSIPLLIPLLAGESQNLRDEVDRALQGIAKVKLDGTAASWEWWWSQQPEERGQ